MTKRIIAAILFISFLTLLSCSPKTSQPCPKVYKKHLPQDNSFKPLSALV